jgi:hypothetical protein
MSWLGRKRIKDADAFRGPPVMPGDRVRHFMGAKGSPGWTGRCLARAVSSEGVELIVRWDAPGRRPSVVPALLAECIAQEPAS